MALHNKLGTDGEQAALAFLKKNGLEILHVNWRRHPLEVDIVAREANVLIFVEVKTRRDMRYGLPEEAVTGKKEKHLFEAAEAYLEQYQLENEVRFDIISVLPREDGWQIRHTPYAFRAFGG